MAWLSTCSPRAHKSFLLVTSRQEQLSASAVARLAGRLGHLPRNVVAIDGGAKVALQMGLAPGVIVGDMDSVPPEILSECIAAGAETVKFSKEKDETDTQLALELVFARGCTSATIVTEAGGRIDHFLGLIMAGYKYVDKGMDIRLVDSDFEAVLAKGPVVVRLEPDRKLYVSLIPVAGDAHGIDIEGLLYPLTDAKLGPGETRGLSNETTGREALIRLREGWLFVTAVPYS